MTTKVLVHCHAGISRSPTAVIYYFMRKYQIDYEAAMQMVNRKRRVAPSDHGHVAEQMSLCVSRKQEVCGSFLGDDDRIK
uniref:ORF66 n=1 Tax=Cydia pomonella granulosis virus TaxID=28289 RepID=A0A097P0P6_GVCP|nr:ORF66 ptp-2 [Cydia pomonella granulovirus]QDW81125.1 ptp-2 [Cydia pomonella granulovirus]QGY99949.1 ORF66 [Cydia pomonella granulovirus]